MQNNDDSLPPALSVSEGAPSKRNLKWLVKTVKFIVLALVVFWLGKTLVVNWREISQYDWRPQYGWLVAAGAFYLLGFFPAAFFWNVILRQLGQRSDLFRVLVAYYYSQLGKYVPGKAMIVVIRTGLLTNRDNQASVVAASVFYETLTMMGSGAFFGAVILFFFFHSHHLFALLALLAACGTLAPLLPPVFVRICRLLRVGKNNANTQEALSRLRYGTLLIGLVLMAFLWLFWGISLWAVINGLGLDAGEFFTNLPRYVSITSLATSLGFFVLVSPGGLGVRETILSALLIPYLKDVLTLPTNSAFTFDPQTLSTIISLLQRIVSILAELLCFAGLYLVAFVMKAKSVEKDNG